MLAPDGAASDAPSRQSFLEEAFPAYHASPTETAIASAAKSDDKALDADAKAGGLVEPKLNIANTAIKTALDQTVGAVANTFLFSMFMHSIQAAMTDAPRGLGARASARWITAPGAIDYSKVDWELVAARSRAEFWPIMKAGWRLWPFVSVVNFAFVKSVEGRNLVGSVAGVAWGIYISLFAAR